MKKTILFILILFMLPLVIGSTYTDFSRDYIQTKCSPEYTGDCFGQENYMLRSTSVYTGINYSSSSWDLCGMGGMGSEDGVLPISFYTSDSNYSHNSLIALYDNFIIQYASDCSSLDTYSISGEVVSKLGIINKGSTTHNDTLPYFAYLYNNTNAVNNSESVYMEILTLDPETSKFIRVANLMVGNDSDWMESSSKIGLGTKSVVNVAGGGIYANDNNPWSSARVFGAFSRTKEQLFIAYGYSSVLDIVDPHDLFNMSLKVAINTSYDSVNHYLSAPNDLFFDDWEGDGTNEFIIISTTAGVAASNEPEIDVITVQPLTSSPFYFLTNQINTGDLYSMGSGFTFGYGFMNGSTTICQIGYPESELEICYSVGRYEDYDAETGILNNDGTLLINYTNTGWTYISPPFSFKKYGDDYKYGCIAFNSSASQYRCYDLNKNVKLKFNTTKSLATLTNNFSFIVSSIDGDESQNDYELIWSDGNVEKITINGTNTPLTDWTGSHTSAWVGKIYIQDLNNDEWNELIYSSDRWIKIYSMNNTPPTFYNYSEYSHEVTTTTTTSTTTTTLFTPSSSGDFAGSVFGKLQSNINLIFAFVLMLGLSTMAYVYTKSSFIAVIGGVMGLIISVGLGMISTTWIIIMVVMFVLLAILGFTVLGKQ